MEALIKLSRSKGANAVSSALLGALIGYIIAIALRWFVDLLAGAFSLIAIPPLVYDFVFPTIGALIVLGHAGVGVGAGLGMFHKTRLGRFLYYGGISSYFWGTLGQVIGMAIGIAFY